MPQHLEAIGTKPDHLTNVTLPGNYETYLADEALLWHFGVFDQVRLPYPRQKGVMEHFLCQPLVNPSPDPHLFEPRLWRERHLVAVSFTAGGGTEAVIWEVSGFLELPLHPVGAVSDGLCS